MWVCIFTNLYKLQLNLGKGLLGKNPHLQVKCKISLCKCTFQEGSWCIE